MERLMFDFFTENGDFQITIKTVSSRCAQRHYQNKALHNLRQPENFICTGIEEKNTKNNSESKSIRNKIPGILSKICFVYIVTFVWKGVLSSEIYQITDNLIKRRLRQVFLMGCLTVYLSHPEKSVSSHSALEIFDLDPQDSSYLPKILYFSITFYRESKSKVHIFVGPA